MTKSFYHQLSKGSITALFLLSLFTLSTLQAQETDLRSKIVKTIDGEKYYMHIVEQGQTLYGIARIYNSNVDELIKENPESLNGVRYGMILRVPYDPEKIVTIDESDKVEGDAILHKVQSGETLYSLARKYRTSVEEISKLNKLTAEQKDALKLDQIIKIPKPASFVTPASNNVANKPDTKQVNTGSPVAAKGTNVIEYTVKPGETLRAIAKNHATTVENILKLNGMNAAQADAIKAGQIIKVPLAVVAAAPTTEPAKPATTPTLASTPKPKEEIKTVVTSSIAAVKTVSTTPVDNTPSLLGPPSATAKFGYPGEKKDQYRVAFFLPFHSSETLNMEVEKLVRNEEQFSMKTKIALDFYEGALLAIDSLKKQGLNAKIFVYDMDDNDSLGGVQMLLSNPEIAEMDLIIGPLYTSGFMPVAKFAKQHSIPIVSPFIQANKILFDNPYVCKVTSSNALQIVQMSTFVIDSFHTQNIILVNSGDKKEAELNKTFTDIAKQTVTNKMYNLHDSIKVAKGIPGIAKYLDSTRLNVVVLASNNQAYVTEMINTLHLHENPYKFVVFGMQSWMSYDNLDFDYLNSLSLHVVSNSYLDYHDAETQKFLKKFSRTYNSFPDLYAYSGFDITYNFLSLLQEHGSGFMNHITDEDYKGLISNMEFIKSSSSKSGFENRYVLMLKYENYELKPVN